MKKQYKIQLPKGKKVTMTNVDCEDGVMTVNVELENRKEQKYEPKDGDFVKIEQEGKLYFTPDLGIGYSEKEPSIGIFKSIETDEGKELLFCYITFMRDSQYEVLLPLEHEGQTYSVGEVSNLKVSPATEEEKKLLIDKLAKVNKRWNPETKTIEDVRWRAKDGEPYSYLLFGDTDILVTTTTDTRMRMDDERFNSGNYFKTDSDAEKVAGQIREIFKNSKAE